MSRPDTFTPKYLVPMLFIISVIIGTSSPAFAQDSRPQEVLVLHSYHHGLSWTDTLNRGIMSILEKGSLKVEVQTEHMDTKRICDSTYIRQLYEIYRHKFRDRKFDVIICSDNNALNFLLRYRDGIFPETPVVFCGINNFDNSMVEGKTLYTGTVEFVDIRGTLDIALKLHPEITHIFVYGSNTTTYFANKAILQKIIPDYEDSIDFNFIENLNIRQVQDNIQKLPKNSLILIMCSLRDEHGRLIPFQKFPEMMAAVSSVPIYGCWDFLLGHGIVGGNLISGFAQGKTAAQMALRVLDGEKVESVPVLRKSPNRYMFDYKQMQRFDINVSRLPEGSIVINKPVSFYSEHKGLIWSVVLSTAGLIFIILILATTIIKRKRAEELYQTLAEKSFAGVYLIQDGKFQFINSNAAAYTGYASEEMIGIESLSIVHPEDREITRKHSIEMLKKQRTAPYEFRILTKNGEIRWIMATLTSIHYDGKPTVLGNSMDITEQKRVEEALRESEKRLTLALEASNSGIWEFNPHTFTDTHYSDRWVTMLGYEPGELPHTTETWTKLMHPEDIERVQRKLQDHTKERNPYSAEFRMRTKEGGYRWIYSVGKIVSWDDRGNPERMIGIHIDIDARRQAEERLLQSKYMLQAVFDGILDPLMMLGGNLSIKILNKPAMEYYQAPEFAKVIGRPCFEALRGKTRPCKGCEIPAAIQRGERTTFERRGIVSSDRYERIAIYPLKEKESGLTGAIVHIHDVTETKKIQEQLIRADRLASLGQLSGGIAHEIRNPLTGISLFLDVLGDKEKFDQTDSELEVLDEIRDNVNKIDGIIRRILDFAKPTIRASAKIDINAVVREEIKFWSAKIRNSEIDLRLYLGDNVPPVFGDPIELRQVWNNLVQNALEVMEKGGSLDITTTRGISSFHKDRQVVIIKIKDTGPGIKPEHKGNLFNPFFTTKAGGTGLGLAISHKIIERHGGTILLESELNEGTTFTVELPAVGGD